MATLWKAYRSYRVFRDLVKASRIGILSDVIDFTKYKQKRSLIDERPFSAEIVKEYKEAVMLTLAYKDKLTCEDWKLFSNFRAWMEKQDWEGKELDKDLLGNGRLYSPDNCCFISQKLNSF